MIACSGELLCIVATRQYSAPAGGYEELAAVGSVSGMPTLYRNGRAIALYGPLWNDGSSRASPAQNNALVAYWLSDGAVVASDLLTLDLPGGFINTQFGATAAVTGAAVANFAGRPIESAYGALPGLDVTPTMGAGFNETQPATYSGAQCYPWANQVFRSDLPGFRGPAGTTYDVHGNPVSWPVSGSPHFHVRCYLPNHQNGLDNMDTLQDFGVWSVVWDDPAVGTLLATTVTPGVNTGYATMSVGPPAVSGNRTILPVTVLPRAGASQWTIDFAIDISAPANNLGGSDGLAHWALGAGPFVVPPNSADGSQQPASFLNSLAANPLRCNPNVVAQATAGGKVPYHIRWFSSTLGVYGEQNYIYPSDMPDARQIAWQIVPGSPGLPSPYGGTSGRSVTFRYVRRFYTDPAKGPVASGGDGTYAWKPSTRIYGPQSDLPSNDGAAANTTIHANLTAGARRFTFADPTFPVILAGGVITGTGIPAGPPATRLAHFDAIANWGILTNPATTTAANVPLTLAAPNYAPLPAGDNGFVMTGNWGAKGYVVVELRSELPHGLSTMQRPSYNGQQDGYNSTNSNVIQVSNFGNWNPYTFQRPIYVTGEYTIAAPHYVGFPGDPLKFPAPPAGWPCQIVDQVTEYDFGAGPHGGWQVALEVPMQANAAMPPEAGVALCLDLGCQASWLSLPAWGCDEVYAQIGANIGRVVNDYATANPGATNLPLTLLVELQDEPWNPQFGTPYNVQRANLYDTYPPGTVVSHYLTTRSGLRIAGFPNGGGAQAALTGSTAKMVGDALAATGAPAQLKLLYNGQFAFPDAIATGMVNFCQLFGIPCDYLVTAPYVSNCTARPVVVACTAASAGGGGLSIPAINDYSRLYHVYDRFEMGSAGDYYRVAQSWGQPTAPLVYGYGEYYPSTPPNNLYPGAASYGLHSPFWAGGNYQVWYTFADSAGHETTVGNSWPGTGAGGYLPANNWSLQVVMPLAPGWVADVNFYFNQTSPPDPTTASRVLSIPVSGTGSVAAGQYVYISQWGTGPAPPATNQATAMAGAPPRLGTYEGGEVITAPCVDGVWDPDPLNVPDHVALQHDCRAHPSFRRNVWTWYASQQIGTPWVPGSGMTFATWFGAWSGAGPNAVNLAFWDEFLIYGGTAQPVGDGSSNHYATTRPGTTGPGDGRDHNGGVPPALVATTGSQARNVSTGGLGLQDWIAGTVPTVLPGVTAVNPARGATNVPASAVIQVTYSKSMNPALVALTLDSATVPFTGYNNATFTASFTPASPLTSGHTFAASATGTAADGTAMAGPYLWSFTVASPPIVSRRFFPKLR
jgi:hypothetical protein